MLPPINSLQHQNLKLAEFISSTQSPQAPPPAYSSTTLPPPTTHDDLLTEEDDDYDYDYDNDYHSSSRPPPFKITIDATLKIEGHGNTILLPCSPSPPPHRAAPTPSSSSPSSQPAPPTTVQTGRVEKLTTSVLTALKQAGLLDKTVKPDGRTENRPIDLHVDAAIVVKGSRNTICAGVPKLGRDSGAGAGVAGLKRKAEAEAECNREKAGEDGAGIEGLALKRRACSEPPEMPMVMTKRTRAA